ncbi:MAG: hypothetical protein Q4A00_02220 [Flavobacteriaceae bacterium]|nr:hypothetical protein [Flavobacteriaceae bacterium]
MSIKIKEVVSKSDFKTFIYLPEKIHQNHKNWVHPLYIDEEKFFNKDKNPAFKNNETIMLLAYENQEPVGRIMGIIPTDFNASNQVKTARFSYFECYERKDIFDALLKEVETWAREKGCNQIIGPMGFSDKEPQGFLTSGFEELHMPVTNHTFGYMKNYTLENAYTPYVELCQYEVPLTKDLPQTYEIFVQRVLRNHRIKIQEFTSTKEIKPFVKGVFELINSTYTDIYGFTKVSEEEANEFANRFLPLLNPKLIKILTNDENKVIAFVIAMPNINEGIKKAKGRLFPFGWYHIFQSMRKSKRLVLLLGGVQNEMQNKGLDAILALKLISSALELGFTILDSHLIMKENAKMRGTIERIANYKMYKEYTIFSKPL